MTTSRSRRATCFLILFVCVALPLAAQPQPQQLPALPKQAIVLVVDNSMSMQTTDPLGLRGVAGSLVLDAAEIASDVEAGVVFFDNDAESDGRFHPPDAIRQRLSPQQLPQLGGGTNMLNGLEVAVSMFSGSTANIRRIVLITDGMPDPPGQQDTILNSIVPNAARSGIEIFALGMTTAVNQEFLDKVTRPTGGKTLIARQHHELLRMAKQLMGNHDNVFTIADKPLADGTNEYEVSIASSVDRARITAILDHPRDFAPGDITLTLSGPPASGERPYIVRTDSGDDRVAAWTTFFSTPGTYRLQVETQKPGGHKGMRIFVEALSNLRVTATLNPPLEQHQFGDEITIEAKVATSSGTVTDPDLRLTGTVRTSGGGTEIVTFGGGTARFRVRDVAGRHTVIVKAELGLARAETRLEYEAVIPKPIELTATPEKLEFTRPLGAVDTKIEATFKLVPEFAEGENPRPVRVSFMFTTPVGLGELTTGGSTIRPAPGSFTLRPAGAEVVFRIKLDPNRPLPRQGGKYAADIRIFSDEGRDLIIPFEYQVRIPEFKVKSALDAFALWWDPKFERTVSLGSLHTDLADASTVSVTMPDALGYPNRGTLIAALSLLADGKPLDPTPAEAGKVRYGPIELKPGEDLPLELVIKPRPETGWQNLPAAQTAFDIELASDLGMQTKISPKFQTVGPPLIGRIDRHGRGILTLVVVGLSALLVILLALMRLAEVRKYWPVRPRKTLSLRFGPIELADAQNDSAALVLPNPGSALDNETVGNVSADSRKQRVESVNGYLTYPRPLLTVGDVLTIGEEDSAKPAYELMYVNSTPGEGGEVEVLTNPSRWSLGRVVRKLIVGAILTFVVYFVLGLGIAAAFAYHFRFVEAFYLRALN